MRQWLKRILMPMLPSDYYSLFHVILPRKLRALFARQTPVVQFFSLREVDQETKDRLEGANVIGATRLCRLMVKHGSDKGGGWHNYTVFYSRLFRKLRRRKLRVFELGLGTNDPLLPSTMGVNGKPGASLRAWRDYFPNADVYGADVDERILFNEERISTFFCDQREESSVQQLWQAESLLEDFDIIIEDGLHQFDANCVFLENSLHKLRVGGWYVGEDIAQKDLGKWRDRFSAGYLSAHSDFQFCIVEIPNSANHKSNSLVVVHRVA